VGNLQKGKEWLSKKIILNVENLLERDITVIIQDQDGNQDIGLVERGKLKLIWEKL
jgi:hypothetical protein